MLFMTYDPRGDVMYVQFHGEEPERYRDLRTRHFADGLRHLDVDPDGEPMGIEFLNVRREGVNLQDVPMAEDIAEMLEGLAAVRIHNGESWLARTRHRLNLTQEQLAQALGVTSTTVARWERGEREVNTPNMLRLALQALSYEASARREAAPPQGIAAAETQAFDKREAGSGGM